MKRITGGPRKSGHNAVYGVALAGICAALALMFVWLSVLVRFSTVAFYIAAGCCLMVPLTKRYYVSSIFAYVASAALAFLIAGDVFTVIGYIAYFGPMSIATGIMYEHRVKQIIAVPIKLVYINLALAFMYYVAGNIMIDESLLGAIPYWAIAIVGSVILIVIDFAMQYIFRCLKPIVGKVIKEKKEAPPVPEEADRDDADDEEEDSNPFE